MTAVGASTRERILDTAFELTTAENSTGISMRRLADACGVNVATIYHHFPSKADLLRSVMAERRYGERLATEGPALDQTLAPRVRLAELLAISRATLHRRQKIGQLERAESDRLARFQRLYLHAEAAFGGAV